MSQYPGLPRATWWMWKAQFESLRWVVIEYWPASIVGIGGFVAEHFNAIEPAGLGFGLGVGWWIMAMLVGMDHGNDLYRKRVRDFREDAEARNAGGRPE